MRGERLQATGDGRGPHAARVEGAPCRAHGAQRIREGRLRVVARALHGSRRLHGNRRFRSRGLGGGQLLAWDRRHRLAHHRGQVLGGIVERATEVEGRVVTRLPGRRGEERLVEHVANPLDRERLLHDVQRCEVVDLRREGIDSGRGDENGDRGVRAADLAQEGERGRVPLVAVDDEEIDRVVVELDLEVVEGERAPDGVSVELRHERDERPLIRRVPMDQDPRHDRRVVTGPVSGGARDRPA